MTLERMIFGRAGNDVNCPYYITWRLLFLFILSIPFLMLWGMALMSEIRIEGVTGFYCCFGCFRFDTTSLMRTIDFQVAIYGGVFLLSLVIYSVLWIRKKRAQKT